MKKYKIKVNKRHFVAWAYNQEIALGIVARRMKRYLLPSDVILINGQLIP